MFVVGHLAFGYIFAKVCQRLLKVDVNLPLVFLLSLLPDADLLFFHGLLHRGVTHSVIVLTVVFIPVFLFYKKRSVPYYVALIQHVFPGDFITSEGAQIFWPLSTRFYTVGISMESALLISIECTGFILALIIMILTKDLFELLKPQTKNLILILPGGAALVSAALSWVSTASVALLVCHGILLVIFAVGVLRTLLSAAANYSNVKTEAGNSLNRS